MNGSSLQSPSEANSGAGGPEQGRKLQLLGVEGARDREATADARKAQRALERLLAARHGRIVERNVPGRGLYLAGDRDVRGPERWEAPLRRTTATPPPSACDVTERSPAAPSGGPIVNAPLNARSPREDLIARLSARGAPHAARAGSSSEPETTSGASRQTAVRSTLTRDPGDSPSKRPRSPSITVSRPRVRLRHAHDAVRHG